MADMLLDHRYPTIRIVRDHAVEPGTRIALYWDGARAPNGDGVPNDGGVDYTNALHVSKMWSKGHRWLFGGGFGLGGFGTYGADPDPAMGFAKGPFAIGGFACGGGYWQWTTPFPWRNGTYTVAVRLRDALGNESATVSTTTIEIAALPRPSSRAWLDAIGDGIEYTVRVGWRASPEFEPTE